MSAPKGENTITVDSSLLQYDAIINWQMVTDGLQDVTLSILRV